MKTEKNNSLNPIPFANGTGGTGRGATLALDTIFKEFPIIAVPMTVTDRIETNDTCINRAVEAFIENKGGFKNSTASADPEIVTRGWKSANIVMRPLMNAFGIFRILQAEGAYPNMCGTLRYAHGGFYDEVSCEEKDIDGVRTAVITQHLNLDHLRPFALLAERKAKELGLYIVISSKSTISKSELLFRDEIEKVWLEIGMKLHKTRDGNSHLWTHKDAYHKLTDMALASLPRTNASGLSEFADGGFLHVADNANGDTSSDIIDIQHGQHTMGSRVYCLNERGEEFSYEELPGGTANGKTTGPMKANKFLSPAGIIFALSNEFEKVNPVQKEFFDEVRRLTRKYLLETKKGDLDTEEMLSSIAEQTQHILRVTA